MEEPVYYWDPVIGPSGLAFYAGNLFPQWKNSMFVGGLRGAMLARLEMKDDKVIGEEPLLDGAALAHPRRARRTRRRGVRAHRQRHAVDDIWHATYEQAVEADATVTKSEELFVVCFLTPYCAIVFVIGALLLKRASDLGADVWRTTRIINYTTAAVSLGLWTLGGTIPAPSLWWQPPVAATLFFSGQVFSLLALNTGDVSVATPVLGVKILLVALLSTVLIGDPIGARLWTAAGLSSVAVALLNLDRGHPHSRVGRTIVLAALGSCVVRMLRRAHSEVVTGVGNRPDSADRDGLRGCVFSAAAIFSRSADLQVGRPSTSRAYTPWLVAGALSFAVQGLMFITSISI